jgi:hypothetical protein
MEIKIQNVVFNHVKIYLKGLLILFCFGLVFVLPRLGIFKAGLLFGLLFPSCAA